MLQKLRLNSIVDATGIKVQGEGEWKVKIHGKGRPRKWIKLHVAVDEQIQEIVEEISTEAMVDDRKALPQVMQQVKCRPKTVIGDGAYDAIQVIRAFGGDKAAKAIWGKLSGYSRRALVETTFSRYKKMFGERAFSRTQERVVLENKLKCILPNKMIRTAV
jgi:hypothetical protein